MLCQVSAATPELADTCSGWLHATDDDVRNLARMLK
jgi:hypothetical protein